jgi:hypothetical protein
MPLVTFLSPTWQHHPCLYKPLMHGKLQATF